MTSEQKYRYVGYVRSVALVKTIHMFPTEGIRALRAWRSVQRETQEKDSFGDWVFRKKSINEFFTVDWNAKKSPGVFPLEKLTLMVGHYTLGDMVLESLTFEFTDPFLSNYLNTELKVRGRKGVFTDASIYQAKFDLNSYVDAKNIPYIRDLNRTETDVYKFKTATLDLVEWTTERKIKYGEKEMLSPNEEPKVIRAILRHLDWEGWRSDQRIVAGITLNPVAIRQYVSKDREGWVLSKNIEVDGE